MTAGEGIFYGLVFLGLIYLYLQTKDRWNWKKIVIYFVSGVVALIVVFVGYIYISDKVQQGKFVPYKPSVVSSLLGVSIGEKVSDVIFRTGATHSKKSNDESYEFPSDTNKFFQGDKQGLVDRVGVWCSNDMVSYPNLYSPVANEIRCGDSSETILSKYGKDKVRILCLTKSIGNISADSARSYDAVDYGARYVLITNKVAGIYIYKPEDLQDIRQEKWGTCK